MGASWQSDEQKEFIENYAPSYAGHVSKGTEKAEFWPDFLEDWFKRWPLAKPSLGPDQAGEPTQEEGPAQDTAKADRKKKISQLKRVLKRAIKDNATGGRRNLRLEGPVPRRRSEVQVYMNLYYDTRIRPTVVKRWEEAKITIMNFPGLDIPEDQIDPKDSALLKDNRISIAFKNEIAQELFDAEEEGIKEVVRSKYAESLLPTATVYDASEEDRLALVGEYQKNILSLGKGLMNVLKNAEQRCCAKGIVWLACPTPPQGGKPVAHFKCSGKTTDGQDFEAFIGAEKAEEMKQLFSNWIHTIYPASDWPLFSSARIPEATIPTTTVDGATDDLTETTRPVPKSPTSSLVPKPVILSLTSESSAPSDQLGAIPFAPDRSQSGEPPTHPLHVSDQLGAGDLCPSDGPQPDPPCPLVTPTTFTVPEIPLPNPTQDSAHPSRRVGEPRQAIPGHVHSQTSARPLDSARSHEESSHTKTGSPSTILSGITNEPMWMKNKRTLDYFRNTSKLGSLPNIIEHWYELERLLGFKETTGAGFPIGKRPKVIRLFQKNAHNYRKDYHLKAHTLGYQITEWWGEISPPGGIPKVQFGGSTGMYSLVVLMSWWCKLVEDKPDAERVDCLHMLMNVDRALSMAIDKIKKHPIASTSLLPSATPLPSQSRKRANTNAGKTLSHKRQRVGQV